MVDTNDRFDSIVKQATAAFGVVTTVLAAVGTVSGDLQRTLRNFRGLVLVAIVFLVFALVFSAIAVFVKKSPEWLLALSGGLFAGSLVIGLVTAVRTAGLIEQPSISAKVTLGSRVTVDATVTESGLRAEDRLHVFAFGDGPHGLVPLFQADIGPDTHGDVSLPISIPLRPGEYTTVVVGAATSADRDCNHATDTNEQTSVTGDERLGCLRVLLPTASARPQLTAALTKDSTGTQLVDVTISASGVGSHDLVAVEVLATGSGRTHSLYSSLLAADTDGVLQTNFQVPLPPNVKLACALALNDTDDATDKPPIACPPSSKDADLVGVVLTVPS